MLIFSTSILVYGQQSENDIINEMCLEFKNTENLSDSLRIENMLSKKLYPYLRNIETSKVDSIGTSLFIRLQKDCPEFRSFLLKESNTNNFIPVDKMPEGSITTLEKKEFTKTKRFYYYEGATDEKTKVLIENGYWFEKFPDNTYSKCKLIWTSNNEYALEFIESNNEARKSFNKKGDIFQYKLIKKENNYYIIAAQIKGQTEILLFKLYEE